MVPGNAEHPMACDARTRSKFVKEGTNTHVLSSLTGECEITGDQDEVKHRTVGHALVYVL